MEILIVEDEKEIAQLISNCLQREGFNCHSVYDGLSALEKVKTIQPDLIILDLMLPYINGLDLCRLIRREGNNVPI